MLDYWKSRVCGYGIQTQHLGNEFPLRKSINSMCKILQSILD